MIPGPTWDGASVGSVAFGVQALDRGEQERRNARRVGVGVGE